MAPSLSSMYMMLSIGASNDLVVSRSRASTISCSDPVGGDALSLVSSAGLGAPVAVLTGAGLLVGGGGVWSSTVVGDIRLTAVSSVPCNCPFILQRLLPVKVYNTWRRPPQMLKSAAEQNPGLLFQSATPPTHDRSYQAQPAIQQDSPCPRVTELSATHSFGNPRL